MPVVRRNTQRVFAISQRRHLRRIRPRLHDTDAKLSLGAEQPVRLMLVAMPGNRFAQIQIDDIDIALSGKEIGHEAPTRICMDPQLSKPDARRCHFSASPMAFL